MSRFVIRRILKILCIASVLIMMLCLCGCRARLTNNDEVLSAVYNDDEYMQEEYQMRRDALGLGEAKKPIFNGLGSAPEEEEVFDEGDANRLEELKQRCSRKRGKPKLPEEEAPAAEIRVMILKRIRKKKRNRLRRQLQSHWILTAENVKSLRSQ